MSPFFFVVFYYYLNLNLNLNYLKDYDDTHCIPFFLYHIYAAKKRRTRPYLKGNKLKGMGTQNPSFLL
jgi:hypothetical protein